MTRLAVTVVAMVAAMCVATLGTPAAYVAAFAAFVLAPAVASVERRP